MSFNIGSPVAFSEVPAKRGGGGGGGKPSPLLDAVRQLPVNQCIPVRPDNPNCSADEFKKFVASISSSLSRQGALPFRATTRTDTPNRTVNIFRLDGSDLAFNADGTPVMSTIPGRKGKLYQLTVKEATALGRIS